MRCLSFLNEAVQMKEVETIIIDDHFSWWYRDNRDLAPEWFDEAIVQTRRRIVPMLRLS